MNKHVFNAIPFNGAGDITVSLVPAVIEYSCNSNVSASSLVAVNAEVMVYIENVQISQSSMLEILESMIFFNAQNDISSCANLPISSEAIVFSISNSVSSGSTIPLTVRILFFISAFEKACADKTVVIPFGRIEFSHRISELLSNSILSLPSANIYVYLARLSAVAIIPIIRYDSKMHKVLYLVSEPKQVNITGKVISKINFVSKIGG